MTRQTMLLLIGVVVVLASALLHRLKVVKSEQKIRRGPFICGLVITALGISLPSLLRWLGYI